MKAAWTLAASVLTAAALSANGGPPVDIPTRARGAERVVIATVVEVYAGFERNEFGIGELEHGLEPDGFGLHGLELDGFELDRLECSSVGRRWFGRRRRGGVCVEHDPSTASGSLGAERPDGAAPRARRRGL